MILFCFLMLKENHVSTHRVVFVFKQFELIPKETIEAFVSLIR